MSMGDGKGGVNGKLIDKSETNTGNGIADKAKVRSNIVRSRAINIREGGGASGITSGSNGKSASYEDDKKVGKS